MGFHEIRFPESISYGSSGGPGYSTSIVETDSGAEQRIARWSSARRRYDVAYGVKSFEDLSEVLSFYIARQGPANGFRFKDHLDFTTASDHRSAHSPTDEVLVHVDPAVSQTQFQLIKRYTSGNTTKIRTITKPVLGAIRVAVNGVEQVTGWTANTTTGVITFEVAKTADQEVTAGCQFDVPVRFGEEIDESLAAMIDDYDNGSIRAIPLVELKDGVELPDEMFYGGAIEVAIYADYTITAGQAKLWIFDTDTFGLQVHLPDPENPELPSGGPIFTVINEGSQSISLRSHDGTELVALGTNDGVDVFLAINQLGERVWYAI